MSNSLYGLYRAVVHNNVDPGQRNRLLVEAPSVSADPLAWAEACVSSTQFRSPNIGDAVWIMFEGGDVDHPVWIGVHPGQAA